MATPVEPEQPKETEGLDSRTYVKRTIDGVTVISPAPAPDALIARLEEIGATGSAKHILDQHIEITRLTAEVERLREGLAFYADGSNWSNPFGMSSIIYEGGKIARAALTEAHDDD